VLVIIAASLNPACLLEIAKQKYLLLAQLVSTLLAYTDLALAVPALALLDLEVSSAIRLSIVPDKSPTNQRPLINVVFAEETELPALVVMENCMVPNTTTAVFAEEMELNASIHARIFLTVLLASKILLAVSVRVPRNVSRYNPPKVTNALSLLPLIACLCLNLSSLVPQLEVVSLLPS